MAQKRTVICAPAKPELASRRTRSSLTCRPVTRPDITSAFMCSTAYVRYCRASISINYLRYVLGAQNSTTTLAREHGIPITCSIHRKDSCQFRLLPDFRSSDLRLIHTWLSPTPRAIRECSLANSASEPHRIYVRGSQEISFKSLTALFFNPTPTSLSQLQWQTRISIPKTQAALLHTPLSTMASRTSRTMPSKKSSHLRGL